MEMEMETTHGLNYLATSTSFGGDGGRGHNNSNCTSSLAWDIWPLGTTSSSPSSSRRYHQYHDWSNNTHNSFTAAGAPPSTLVPDRSGAYTAATLVCQVPNSPRPYDAAAGPAGTHYKAAPDPHLMCLKLGKRHYFEDGNFSSNSSSTVPHQLISDHYDRYLEEEEAAAAADMSINPKRGKLVVFPYDACGGPNYMVGGTSTGVTVAVPPVPVPKCQVQGCEAMLSKGKEYHRRHKVCEMHSKAPKAMVLGLQQRFCQQCSRFHAVSEFDESKRSCRRRLAGHNERRRKSSHDHSLSRIPPQENKLGTGRFPHLPSPTGPALSLLSSKNESWISSSDLSSRCSAALRELIAENRASIFSSRQLTPDKDWNWNHHAPEPLLHQTQKNSTHPDQLATNPQQLLHDSQIWDRFHHGADANVTLNLAPSSAFGFLSMRDKANKEADECSEFWRSLGGTHVV